MCIGTEGSIVGVERMTVHTGKLPKVFRGMLAHNSPNLC